MRNLNKKPDLLQAIGGKENVTAVTLYDTDNFVLETKRNSSSGHRVDSSSKGPLQCGVNFQVIDRMTLPIFYNDFTAVSGIEGVSKEAAKSTLRAIKRGQRVMTTLAGFTDSAPDCRRLITRFHNVLEGVHWSVLVLDHHRILSVFGRRGLITSSGCLVKRSSSSCQ